ncbi:hypothetical protein CHH28_18500 [Bacterioplanes sanyensis]|uniref:ParD-like family protein n=1 Tax=Bacterioplanes sanyensis TaxID=1249553 RepID=A0A222FPT4_9GAMM|nr:ParD-like family protein [Bacterioplanes sanyensis]ASP40536.1 hypothetical protein CHH28_18500 [Bacterioplanes sanyensis]
MGIVKINDELHDDLRDASQAMSRSINAQAEHWLRLGMLAELNPELTYPQLTRLLLQHPQASLQDLLKHAS